MLDTTKLPPETYVQKTLLCPICKTPFVRTLPENHLQIIPTCCSLGCLVTLKFTCQSVENAKLILKDLSEQQDLFGPRGAELIDVELTDLINQPVKYGAFSQAPIAEKANRIIGAHKDGAPLEEIAEMFSLPMEQVKQLYEFCLMGRKAMRTLIQVRDLMKRGCGFHDIARVLNQTEKKARNYVSRHIQFLE